VAADRLLYFLKVTVASVPPNERIYGHASCHVDDLLNWISETIVLDRVFLGPDSSPNRASPEYLALPLCTVSSMRRNEVEYRPPAQRNDYVY
jgi:hypothetical protein